MALKTMVLEEVYSTYIFSLNNVFMGSSINDITNHLMPRYVQITEADIVEKKKVLT